MSRKHLVALRFSTALLAGVSLISQANPLECTKAIKGFVSSKYEGLTKDKEGNVKGVNRIEHLFNETVPLRDVSNPRLEKKVGDLKVFKISEVFEGDKEVFLGFGKPNVYLTIPDGKGGYMKFAGKSVKRAPSKIEDTRGFVQSGVLIRFKNLPEGAVEALHEGMKKHDGEKFWTCVNANCQVMQDAGFASGNRPLKDMIFPVDFLRSLFEHGLTYNGKPVEYEVIRTAPLDLQKYGWEVIDAEVNSIKRHAQRALSGGEKEAKDAKDAAKTPAFVAFSKNLKQKTVDFFFPKDPEADAEAAKKLTGKVVAHETPAAPLPEPKQEYISDLQLSVTEPSKLGGIVKALWGPHSLFEVKQSRVPVDKYLPDVLKEFPNENPNLATQLKQNILFSKPVVTNIRAQMAMKAENFGEQNAKQIYDLLRVHSDENPNKYNIVITGDGAITIARLNVRHKFVDWLLTKHVLISNYNKDVRFAGEVWKGPDGKLYLNGNSGTYQPKDGSLPQAVKYVTEVLQGNVPVEGVGRDGSSVKID